MVLSRDCDIFTLDKGSLFFMGWGVGIYTKVAMNVANHLGKAFMMVHDEECEGKN